MAAEVTLAVDPSEAASIWRAEKLRDFVWRARCAGIEGDPEVARLIEDLRAHTSSLEEVRAADPRPPSMITWGGREAPPVAVHLPAPCEAFGSGCCGARMRQVVLWPGSRPHSTAPHRTDEGRGVQRHQAPEVVV